ncbi:MAG TPA: pitrilysin family protein [Gemmatimonadales bacterium]|nr:pitrilysin family protein [Gemmatimonadales bacterium]
MFCKTRVTAGWALALGALVMAPLAASAQKPAAGTPPELTPGASVEGIQEYTLPNGLRVLLFPDPSKPTATVNITYLVGSRNEAYGETGMAHLLEHLMFKGSTGHTNIPQELTEHGARPNGTTWLDRTNYFETFASSPENLAWALDLEADRMVHSFIAKKDLESEFTVVRNEFEMGENSPFNVLQERVMSTAFLWHNYGKSTIGARSDIENVPIERLQNFYQRYYQPDNAVLVVSGKFDEPAAKQLIREKFGAIPRPDRSGVLKIYPTYTVEPTQDGERDVTLRRVGDVQVALAAYHIPAGTQADYAAVDVLSHILGDSPSGRLYTALVKPALAADVGAFSYQLKEPGVLMAYANVRKEDSLAPAERALRTAIEGAVSSPATAEEVDRARTAILKQWDLTYNNPEWVALDLSEWSAMGDWRMMFLYRDRVKAVTVDDVKRVAAEYLKPSNLTFGRFIPETAPVRAEIPPTPDVAALVRDYKGDTALVAGEAFDPSPANIDKRTTRGTLPGGTQLALLPKKTRAQTVNVALTLRFGTLDALKGRATVAGLAAEMLERGTKTKTRQQIKDEFDRLKAQVNFFGGATSAGVRIQAQRPQLAAVLRLVGEVLRQPGFDPQEFKELKQETLASIEENRSEPTSQAFIAFNRALNPWPVDDPRATLTVDEQVAATTAATVEQARKFYDDFYGADHAQVAVVGDFDPQEVTSLLSSFLAGWKSRSRYERIPSVYRQSDSAMVVLDTPDKANAMFVSGLNLKLRDDQPSYPALTLGNYMLGGGFLNSRLATRIRQKEGLSYGVGSFMNASAQDESGQWITYAISAPENSVKVNAAFQDEMARVRKDGFTAGELDAARTGWLQSRDVSRAQDGSLAGLLSSELYLGRTMTYDAGVDDQVRKLTPDQVNAAVRAFLDPVHFVTVRAGDFNKKAPPPQP